MVDSSCLLHHPSRDLAHFGSWHVSAETPSLDHLLYFACIGQTWAQLCPPEASQPCGQSSHRGPCGEFQEGIFFFKKDVRESLKGNVRKLKSAESAWRLLTDCISHGRWVHCWKSRDVERRKGCIGRIKWQVWEFTKGQSAAGAQSQSPQCTYAYGVKLEQWADVERCDQMFTETKLSSGTCRHSLQGRNKSSSIASHLNGKKILYVGKSLILKLQTKSR